MTAQQSELSLQILRSVSETIQEAQAISKIDLDTIFAPSGVLVDGYVEILRNKGLVVDADGMIKWVGDNAQ